MTRRVLVIDDEAEVCALVCRVLTRAGYAVETALSGEVGLERLARGDVDCLVVDKQLPGMHGGVVMAEARRQVPGLPVVLLSAQPEPFSLGEERPDVCLAKPFRNLQAIEDAVASAIESHQPGAVGDALRTRLSQVVAAGIAPLKRRRE